METLMIDKFGSMKSTTQNDLHWQYESKRVVVLMETKIMNCKGFYMTSDDR